MIKTFIIGCAVIAVALILALLAAFALRWVAAGEPDANGDPERDGGVHEYRPN